MQQPLPSGSPKILIFTNKIFKAKLKNELKRPTNFHGSLAQLAKASDS